MPPLGPGCNAVESSSLNARAYWQPQATNSPSLRTGPSAGTAAASTVTTTATVYRSGSATVFERLAGESSIGISMIGKRVRQWAEGAGLMLHPSNSVWHALLTYSMAPLKYERLWRRTCAKGRYRLSLLTRPKVCNGTSSAAALREHNVAEERSHADPHQKATNPGQRGRARRHSIPSTTHGGLSAYRVQQEYMRWCQWQLWHFFEQGSSYLTSVWRVSPLLWRQRRHAARCCGGKESTATSPASSVSLIFDGRYTVPSVASIDAAQEEHRTLEKRVKVLLRLLRRENGSSAPASTTRSCSRDNGSNGAATAAHGADDIAASDPDGEGEEDWEEENVYRSANQTRHRSEAVAVTQPFLDVHIDEATALMHLSLYINGDANGNGAEFVGSSVAGCIDNHRWVILKGLWARQVLVFCFYRGEGLPSTTKKQVDGHLKRQGGYDEQTEQDVSRCSHIVEGLVVKGVAFTKMHPGHTLATAQDTFACTRCGHKRRCHNVAYTSKQTGRIVCGVYYCVVCLTRTHHVCIPPMKDLPTVLLGGSEAGAVEGSRVHQLRGLSSVRSSASFSRSTNTTGSGLLPSAYAHWCSGSGSHAADAPQFAVEDAATAMREWTRAAAAAPRPAWLLGSKVNSDELFGRTRGLDCPPPRPRV
ncbi:hypothetical protein Q4I30_005974 [Leishmania utingensis]|uniref:PiggyBac transposable element-derived protein domain-containing protein n=1 Tax=Leishmania utingensis TaxID=653362 RepID=A0AAW3A839_9TRYP